MLLLAVSVPALRSTPALGTANATCRSHEVGPALVIAVQGLKDRAGVLRAELYPANDHDFLADDNVLVAQGKTFRRVEMVPPRGVVSLCIRVPAPGMYALALLHDRNADHKFQMASDGVGFPGNPRLGWAAHRAASASIVAGPGVVATTIVMNYRHGLFSFGPVGEGGR